MMYEHNQQNQRDSREKQLQWKIIYATNTNLSVGEMTEGAVLIWLPLPMLYGMMWLLPVVIFACSLLCFVRQASN